MATSTAAAGAALASMLPEWAMLFAFVASAILTLLKIWEIFRALSKVGHAGYRGGM